MEGTTKPDEPLATALARVAELERSLQLAENAARLSNQELQHFVYAASHDLQEPLRAITTYSQLLERLYPNDPQALELTAFIIAGVSRMTALLHSLLAYSRMNLSPPLTNVKPAVPFQAALFKLKPLIDQTGATIHCADLPDVTAHEGQLNQLFEQLLSNALLFRRQAPVITVSSKESEDEGNPVQVISVQDNGVGIEPQFLAQVLQPFKRLHGKDIPGNGLGLAICEKIMRAHKGKLWLESDGQTGTCAFASFPV